MTIDFDKIKRLVKLVEDNKLTELAVEEEEFRVTIRAGMPAKAVPQAPIAQATTLVEVQPCETHAVEVEVVEPAAAPEPPSEHLIEVISPMVGVFYRKPSPDSPSFVEVGDEIEEGQTLGLIEAMKVFSEVPAEVAGRIHSVPAESGKLVQQGDVLVVIDTSPAS